MDLLNRMRIFKRIKQLKDELNAANDELSYRRDENKSLADERIQLKQENVTLVERAETAEESLKKLNDDLIKSSERTQVTIAFDDSLQQIIPIFKYKGEQTFEKLVEIQALDDRSMGSDNAIQLALLNLSYEAIEQILESYYPAVRSDDD